MRGLWFVGAAVSLVPLVTVAQFNGLTFAGLIVVGLATWRIIKKEGLS